MHLVTAKVQFFRNTCNNNIYYLNAIGPLEFYEKPGIRGHRGRPAVDLLTPGKGGKITNNESPLQLNFV